MNEQSENKNTELTQEQLGAVAGGHGAPVGANKVHIPPPPAKAVVLGSDGKPLGIPPNTFEGGPSTE